MRSTEKKFRSSSVRKQVQLLLIMAMIIAVPFLLFQSCSSSKEEIPQGIIGREKMIAILIDVHEAETKIQLNNLNLNDSTKRIAYGYYNYIFKKHHLKSSDFKSSMDYYAAHLEVLNKMYDEVITGLSKKQAESTGKSNK